MSVFGIWSLSDRLKCSILLLCNYCPVHSCVTTDVVMYVVSICRQDLRCCYSIRNHSQSPIMRRTSLHVHVVETVLLKQVTSYNIMTWMPMCTIVSHIPLLKRFIHEQTNTHELRRCTAEFSNLDLLGLEQILLNMNVLPQS